jgi:glycopeptide antibiotics resistance protein
MFFPLIAVLLSVPFLIYHYRKYGTISVFRTVIIFSFFFYLLCCYFLVILPLPSRNVVAGYTKSFYNLKPFYFVPDLIMNDSFNMMDINSYFQIFRTSKYAEPLFNVFMLIPFGMYLRYYFKCSLPKTVFFSFLLSLFFELTQLSGLYFFYSRPYRLFDVNDLINNTCGGFIGYVICPLFSFFLPSRDKIDSNDYIHGYKVSYGRRFIALLIDYSFVFFITLVIGLFFHFHYIEWIYICVNFIYFCLFYLFFEGYTFGKWFLNYRTVSCRLDGKLSFFSVLFKWLVFHIFILNGWYFIYLYYIYVSHHVYSFLLFYISFFTLFFIYVFLCSILKKTLFYDLILKFDSISVNIGDFDEKI